MMREFPYDFPKENMFKIDNVSPNKSRIELKSFVFFNIVLLYVRSMAKKRYHHVEYIHFLYILYSILYL